MYNQAQHTLFPFIPNLHLLKSISILYYLILLHNLYLLQNAHTYTIVHFICVDNRDYCKKGFQLKIKFIYMQDSKCIGIYTKRIVIQNFVIQNVLYFIYVFSLLFSFLKLFGVQMQMLYTARQVRIEDRKQKQQ